MGAGQPARYPIVVKANSEHRWEELGHSSPAVYPHDLLEPFAMLPRVAHTIGEKERSLALPSHAPGDQQRSRFHGFTQLQAS
jgi:hypothetical protein